MILLDSGGVEDQNLMKGFSLEDRRLEAIRLMKDFTHFANDQSAMPLEREKELDIPSDVWDSLHQAGFLQCDYPDNAGR